MRNCCRIIVVLLFLGLLCFIPWPGVTVAFSGESFGVGDRHVIVEYCYSLWTNRLLYALIRTWPKDATVKEKWHDPRVGKNFFEWTTIRNNEGRIVAAGVGGDVYFFDGAPTFAAEVRSENDYTDAAEAEMAEKRADYFTAGTSVVGTLIR